MCTATCTHSQKPALKLINLSSCSALTWCLLSQSALTLVTWGVSPTRWQGLWQHVRPQTLFVCLYRDLFTMVILQGHHYENYDISSWAFQTVTMKPMQRISLPIWDHYIQDSCFYTFLKALVWSPPSPEKNIRLPLLELQKSLILYRSRSTMRVLQKTFLLVMTIQPLLLVF